MTTIYLERREPARNRMRFYAITVTRTLFDRWAVIREWGRIGHPGTVRETGFDTETAALEAGEQWRERKEKRGYRAVGGSRGLWKLADSPGIVKVPETPYNDRLNDPGHYRNG
jgi:predicted DNA-binding WGR domain protein